MYNSTKLTPPTAIMPEASPSIIASKVLNACDECRARKLKCSGEPTGCARCITDGILCNYSPRKQMGRPRKRRREEGILNTDQDPSGLGQGYEGKVGPQDDVAYSTTNINGQMPILDSNLAGLDMSDSQLYNDDYGQHLGHHHEYQRGQDASYNFDFSQELGADPLRNFPELLPPDPLPNFASNTNTAQLQTPTATSVDSFSGSTTSEIPPNGCRCLPQLYEILSAFQSSPPPSFPYSMAALKRGASLATEVVRCQNCAKEYNLSLQNSMMLGTLMNLLINEYRKLLDHIDERSTSNETLTLRMSELNPGLENLHTGTVDCPMAINIELSGQEWRTLARKTVAKEVFGSPGDQSLAQILEEMRDRQIQWHTKYNGELHQHRPVGEIEDDREHGKNGCVCLQVVYIDKLRLALDTFSL